MSKKLAGKVAVVTGSSKGIGAEIAKHLAAAGATVVVNYSSSKDGAERVVNEINSKEGKAVAVHANVAKEVESNIAKGIRVRICIGRSSSVAGAAPTTCPPMCNLFPTHCINPRSMKTRSNFSN